MECLIQNGLALYHQGDGAPVLLMPYPHGYTLESAAESPLARLLARPGRRLITFDPPGAFGSRRPALVTMAEMLGTAQEALATLGGGAPADLVGHSMGGLCALAYALTCPEQVRRLVLIGSLSGGPAVRRARGLPWHWHWWQPDFWRFVVWGLQVSRGKGSLAVHKRLVQLIRTTSYANPALAPRVAVRPNDRLQPPPVRDRWPRVALGLDYSAQLAAVRAPTLVCVGRHDPQAPVACSAELAQGIPGARLVVFEQSGHYPFLEEPERFAATLGAFLD